MPLGKLLELAKADKQPALGIANTNNLFGALEFSEKAAGKGIQPLIGVELAIDFSEMEDTQEPHARRRGHDRGRYGKGGIVLFAATSNGFANLSSLVSRAHLEGENGRTEQPSSTGCIGTRWTGSSASAAARKARSTHGSVTTWIRLRWPG